MCCSGRGDGAGRGALQGSPVPAAPGPARLAPCPARRFDDARLQEKGGMCTSVRGHPSRSLYRQGAVTNHRGGYRQAPPCRRFLPADDYVCPIETRSRRVDRANMCASEGPHATRALLVFDYCNSRGDGNDTGVYVRRWAASVPAWPAATVARAPHRCGGGTPTARPSATRAASTSSCTTSIDRSP